jgi:hypothetical protein
LSRVITCDESWIYGYDPETAKILPTEKSKLAETENGRQMNSRVKSMLVIF